MPDAYYGSGGGMLEGVGHGSALLDIEELRELRYRERESKEVIDIGDEERAYLPWRKLQKHRALTCVSGVCQYNQAEIIRR
jgi:hypothetical protein